MTDDREIISHCEGCSKPISDGDDYHRGHDVDLCRDCAPSYSDMLSSPEYFLDTEGEPMTKQSAIDIYESHIAAGGSPEDKVGISK